MTNNIITPKQEALNTLKNYTIDTSKLSGLTDEEKKILEKQGLLNVEKDGKTFFEDLAKSGGKTDKSGKDILDTAEEVSIAGRFLTSEGKLKDPEKNEAFKLTREGEMLKISSKITNDGNFATELIKTSVASGKMNKAKFEELLKKAKTSYDNGDERKLCLLLLIALRSGDPETINAAKVYAVTLLTLQGNTTFKVQKNVAVYVSQELDDFPSTVKDLWGQVNGTIGSVFGGTLKDSYNYVASLGSSFGKSFFETGNKITTEKTDGWVNAFATGVMGTAGIAASIFFAPVIGTAMATTAGVLTVAGASYQFINHSQSSNHWKTVSNVSSKEVEEALIEKLKGTKNYGVLAEAIVKDRNNYSSSSNTTIAGNTDTSDNKLPPLV